MALKGTNPIKADHSFVLTAENVSYLDRSLREHFSIVGYRIFCTDGSTKDLDSLEELLNYDNPPSRAILGIEVAALNADPVAAYRAIFQNSNFDTMSVGMDGPSAIQERVLAMTRGLFEGVKAWYAFVPQPAMACLMIAFVAAAITGMIKIRGQNLGDSGSGWPFLLAVVAVLAGVGGYRLCSWIFPVATFAIGFGKNRHQNLEGLRWGVIVAFAVSVVAGFALSIPTMEWVKKLF